MIIKVQIEIDLFNENLKKIIKELADSLNIDTNKLITALGIENARGSTTSN